MPNDTVVSIHYQIPCSNGNSCLQRYVCDCIVFNPTFAAQRKVIECGLGHSKFGHPVEGSYCLPSLRWMLIEPLSSWRGLATAQHNYWRSRQTDSLLCLMSMECIPSLLSSLPSKLYHKRLASSWQPTERLMLVELTYLFLVTAPSLSLTYLRQCYCLKQHSTLHPKTLYCSC